MDIVARTMATARQILIETIQAEAGLPPLDGVAPAVIRTFGTVRQSPHCSTG